MTTNIWIANDSYYQSNYLLNMHSNMNYMSWCIYLCN